jgi:alkanesulfonate monooxygenase SsuD/methylene tetrahydromethanopterin reductase-like flavin-dependent oxidoreductase (luciferase family)
MSNALYGPNKLKLGIFGANLGGGCVATQAPRGLPATWPATSEIAQLSDDAGFEALVPVARWKGFGGPTNFSGDSFETYTWAAGLGAQTRRITPFATSHVPTIHPMVAAKQATTIDHITSGRFALNVVCGWFANEFEMFGRPMMDHETRYDYAEEWLEIVRRLWTAHEEWDYEGRYFRIEKGFMEPKPLQKPHPPIMNAGRSGTGNRFAARFADIVFTSFWESGHTGAGAAVSQLRRLAHEEFQREIQVWSTAFVLCRPTEREARDAVREVIEERGDWVAIDNLAQAIRMEDPAVSPDVMRARKARLMAGYGSYPLVGTPSQIVDELLRLSADGVDGLALTWVDYASELRQFIAEVLPLLGQCGLRSVP